MLTNGQIKLVQMAARSAGIRDAKSDGRYRMLLGHYRQATGAPVKSCKQLNNWQMTDFLAICESMGWRYPGQVEDYYREKARKVAVEVEDSDTLSHVQEQAINYLVGDLGWDIDHLNKFIKYNTQGRAENIVSLGKADAFKIIEGLKAIFGRLRGKNYKNLQEIKEDMEVTNGQTSSCR